MYLYKKDKHILIARDLNQGSAFEKAGFKLVGECDSEGKVIKKIEKETENKE